MDIIKKLSFFKKRNRKKEVPTILQMEASECGAAALTMILAYYGCYKTLEELRYECGVSRDGSNASSLMIAAEKFNLAAEAFRLEPEDFLEEDDEIFMPAIVHWELNHFVVLESVEREHVIIVDPALGRRKISFADFDESFSGVAIFLKPNKNFKKEGSPPSFLKTIRGYLRGYEISFGYLVLVGFVLVIPGVIVPLFYRVFIDKILYGHMFEWLTGFLILFIVVMLLQMTLTGAREFSLTKWETRLAVSNTGRFVWHLLTLPYTFYTQRFSGEVASRVRLNERIATVMTGPVASSSIDSSMIFFYFFFIYQYSKYIALALAAVALFNFWFLRFMGKRRTEQFKVLVQDQMRMIGFASNGIRMIETIKANGAEHEFFSKIAGYQAKILNNKNPIDLYMQLLNIVPQATMSLGSVIVLALGGYLVIHSFEFTLGSLVAVQTLSSMFLSPVNKLVSFGTSLQDLMVDIQRVDDGWKQKPDEILSKSKHIELTENDKSGQAEDELKEIPDKLAGDIEIRNLFFGYDPKREALLKNINLTIKKGESIALVGSSGSGKSTLAKIIVGLYKEWSGEVLFDGKNIIDIESEIRQSSISFVDQEIFLLHGTVKQNITFFDENIPESVVIAAAKDAEIHEDILALNGGYSSLVLENGNNFSGGQRQRLEIARALAIEPTIMIMDEATSALDAIIEEKIMYNLKKRAFTTILLAHRLSTVKDCNKIVVMDKGEIVELGTHEELMKRDGLYKSLISCE